MSQATDKQKAYILQLARRSNVNDNCLSDNDLISKIEMRDSVAWADLTHDQAKNLIAWFKRKRKWRKSRLG